ncbi:hypothetical protein L211DRAFT_794195 [Terfezia boudieri ATCC MYA-4762]|uniref:Uncharacterized protein n=1 Tax=Terfezia boudieri ATCC MYA-4762 TaxID=1051890 RepID=A0A3N4L909_9PEZI|nr:hypothetical protein L211DRAFT_794195 [Terfezia boudieri ATCC MYA-4762]
MNEVSIRSWRVICRSPINRRSGPRRVAADRDRGESIDERVVGVRNSDRLAPWRTLLVDAAANEPHWRSGLVNYPLLQEVQFHYHDIISVVEYLLCQKPYPSDIVWRHKPEYDKQENRVYSEINTAKWWEETQELLPDGGTLVPILLASDETHLTNFSGDKKL